MDEAERCHRIALMHAGRLLALESIPGLRGVFAPDTVVHVLCPDPKRALTIAQEIEGVQEAALFGEGIHVVLRSPDLGVRVRDRLVAAGLSPVEVESITPSLEDVFIHMIRRQGA